MMSDYGEVIGVKDVRTKNFDEFGEQLEAFAPKMIFGLTNFIPAITDAYLFLIVYFLFH